MKIIDLAIANGFRRMKAAVRTNAEMARILGISKAHVGRILKGKTIYLSDDTWSRIKKHLERYIMNDEKNDSKNETIHGVIQNENDDHFKLERKNLELDKENLELKKKIFEQEQEIVKLKRELEFWKNQKSEPILSESKT